MVSGYSIWRWWTHTPRPSPELVSRWKVSDGSTGVTLPLAHSSEIQTVPSGGQPRLPWREYRASAFSHGITLKQGQYGGAPLLPRHRGTPFVNLPEKRRMEKRSPSELRSLGVIPSGRLMEDLVFHARMKSGVR